MDFVDHNVVFIVVPKVGHNHKASSFYSNANSVMIRKKFLGAKTWNLNSRDHHVLWREAIFVVVVVKLIIVCACVCKHFMFVCLLINTNERCMY